MSPHGIPWQEALTAAALAAAVVYLVARTYRVSRRRGAGAGCGACPANAARPVSRGGSTLPCGCAHAPPPP
jgi:hypothetical protein